MKTTHAVICTVLTMALASALQGVPTDPPSNDPRAAETLGMFEEKDIAAAVGPFLRSIREHRKAGEVRLLFVSLLRGEKPFVVVLKTWSEQQLAAGLDLQEESELGALVVRLTAQPVENNPSAVRYVGRISLIKPSTESVLGLQLENNVGPVVRPRHFFVTNFSGSRTDFGPAMAAALVLVRG